MGHNILFLKKPGTDMKLEKFILVNLSEPYKEPLILSDPQGFDPYLHQKAPKSVLLFTQESLTKFSFAL